MTILVDGWRIGWAIVQFLLVVAGILIAIAIICGLLYFVVTRGVLWLMDYDEAGKTQADYWFEDHFGPGYETVFDGQVVVNGQLYQAEQVGDNILWRKVTPDAETYD